MFQGDNFSDMPRKATGIYNLFVMAVHGFAAVTSFLFGYKFLRLFGMEAEIGGLSVDGLLSGLICTLLVDGMCLTMSTLYLRHADTPMQMRIARATYWVMISISGCMSLVYMGAVIADYQNNLQPAAVEVGQWAIALVSVADLFIGAWYGRTGSEFAERLQTAQHHAAMASAMADVTGEIQFDSRQKARDAMRQRKPQLAEHIAAAATNGQVNRMQQTSPAPVRVQLREREATSADASVVGATGRFPNGES